jgi:glucose/arabinose dehydrogenase
MKKVMFAMLALCASVVAVNAQENPAPAPSTSAVAPQQDDKMKIKSDELPEAVKKSLEAQEYKGWLINAAYHHKTADTYEVELKNGAETKTVKFTKDGKKLED